MTTRHHPFIQGHSIKRPPLFDGTNYTLWKIKMKIFIQSQNVDVWRVISQGPHVITRPESEWNESDSKKVQLNSQAIHYLFCAVNSSLFKFICKCSSAKEMWEKLQGMYEETEEVRKSRIYMLNSQYESFRMEEGEGVEEMFGRFETIVYELEFLGKCFSEDALVGKVLSSRIWSLSWKAIVVDLRESEKHNITSFDEVRRNLIAYENYNFVRVETVMKQTNVQFKRDDIL